MEVKQKASVRGVPGREYSIRDLDHKAGGMGLAWAVSVTPLVGKYQRLLQQQQQRLC